MNIPYVDNIFSLDQLEHIKSIVNNTIIPKIDGEYVAFDENNGTGICKGLGRLQIGNIIPRVNTNIVERLYGIASNFTDMPLTIDHAVYAEYNAKYGQPNLPPHFDGDTNDLIINYQLDSNTSWDLGLDLKTYALEDNSALVFNANTDIHWRPHKEFKEGEYVKMLFIRFYNSEAKSDYSYVPNHPNNKAFIEAKMLRDSLKSN